MVNPDELSAPGDKPEETGDIKAMTEALQNMARESEAQKPEGEPILEQLELFDRFVVPESWGDASEEQKDDYRMRVIVGFQQRTREALLSDEKLDQPSVKDFEDGRELFREIYKPEPIPSVQNQTRFDRILEETFFSIERRMQRAYVELRARMLLKSEKKEKGAKSKNK